jgi:hypothetical protein
MSQNTPLARKPLGATMEPGISLNFVFIFKNGLNHERHEMTRKTETSKSTDGARFPTRQAFFDACGSPGRSPHQNGFRVVRVFRGQIFTASISSRIIRT